MAEVREPPWGVSESMSSTSSEDPNLARERSSRPPLDRFATGVEVRSVLVQASYFGSAPAARLRKRNSGSAERSCCWSASCRRSRQPLGPAQPPGGASAQFGSVMRERLLMTCIRPGSVREGDCVGGARGWQVSAGRRWASADLPRQMHGCSRATSPGESACRWRRLGGGRRAHLRRGTLKTERDKEAAWSRVKAWCSPRVKWLY
jgi:hypothetical protein